MLETILRLLISFCTGAVSPAPATLYCYCKTDCIPCENQKTTIADMQQHKLIPEDVEVIILTVNNSNRDIFEAKKISRYPTVIIEDTSGGEIKRFEGLCTAAQISRVFGEYNNVHAAQERNFLRGTVTAVSLVSASCRNSNYPNWNCTLLLQPASPESGPVVLVMPCRRDSMFPELPVAGSVINAEIIPWDNAGDDVRSMGLLDDRNEYTIPWFYSPGFSLLPLAAEEDFP